MPWDLVEQDAGSVRVVLQELRGHADVFGAIGPFDDAQIAQLLQSFNPSAESFVRQQVLRLGGSGDSGHGRLPSGIRNVKRF